MAEKLSNGPNSQQINDAQHLDNMTSLQQLSAVERDLNASHSVLRNQSGLYCMDEDGSKSRALKSWL